MCFANKGNRVHTLEETDVVFLVQNKYSCFESTFIDKGMPATVSTCTGRTNADTTDTTIVL